MAPPLYHPKSELRYTLGHLPSHTLFHTAAAGREKATASAPRAKQEPAPSTTNVRSSPTPRQANSPQHTSTSRRASPQEPDNPTQPPLAPKSTPASSPKAPFISPTSLNAFAVSTLSAHAHPSRPAPKLKDGGLPKNYKSAARRVTLAMVAAPIAIVTSWVLWERLVMGQERKRLLREPVGEEGVERV
ncbi:hypothetical protein MMC11_002854 [Xylographa trunciseda]|nr:hypothetical protein [Xylographa trunciseda]